MTDQWRSYPAYAVSFATIGALWLAHSVITEYLGRANAVLVRLNLLLLMVASFIPFPTRLLAEYGADDGADRIATTIYGLTIFAAAAVLTSSCRSDCSDVAPRADRPADLVLSPASTMV